MIVIKKMESWEVPGQVVTRESKRWCWEEPRSRLLFAQHPAEALASEVSVTPASGGAGWLQQEDSLQICMGPSSPPVGPAVLAARPMPPGRTQDPA